jgi:serine/threonine-protein kinase
MGIASVADFVDALRQNRILEATRLHEISRRVNPQQRDPRPLAKELIDRGWLTPYQANQVLQGHGRELLLGSYLILERLGEGGMGMVFKARHLHMDRIVALKVIREEHVADPEAVRRFHQEIRAAAKLHHPNIVMAFDADQVGNTHFFVMEYVDGIDLAKLVKEQGPLPVRNACEYIRQAALGLQHAFERNMVHRDIKPANLLVTRASLAGREPPMVKILDMGLARLRGPNINATHLTQAGKLVGTPDYIAPEQARNSSKIDIRADLYSLGCTFYAILAGRVPFPGGTGVEKVIRHQMADATPVEKLRKEVPPAVGAVVRKLMAKRPADRYQTPAEVANVLSLLLGAPDLTPGPLRAIPLTTTPPPGRVEAVLPVAIALAPPPAETESVLEPIAFAAYSSDTFSSRWMRQVARQRRMRLLLGIVLAIALAAAGLWWLTRPAREPVRKAALPEPAYGVGRLRGQTHSGFSDLTGQHLPHLPAQCLRFRCLGRLGDHAHDRLGVARPNMDPAILPVQAKAIERVCQDAGPAPLQGREQAGQTVPRHGVLVLDDGVARQLTGQFAQLPTRMGHQVQNQPHANEGVADAADTRVDDAAVALAADHGPDFLHLLDHVGLADGCPVAGAIELPRHVLDGARGGHVDDHRAALLLQSEADGQCEGQFLAEAAARLINQGQAVGVGIEDEADRGPVPGHQRSDRGQVLVDWLRFVAKDAIGITPLTDLSAAQRLQQVSAQWPPRATVGVEKHG